MEAFCKLFNCGSKGRYIYTQKSLRQWAWNLILFSRSHLSRSYHLLVLETVAKLSSLSLGFLSYEMGITPVFFTHVISAGRVVRNIHMHPDRGSNPPPFGVPEDTPKNWATWSGPHLVEEGPRKSPGPTMWPGWKSLVKGGYRWQSQDRGPASHLSKDILFFVLMVVPGFILHVHQLQPQETASLDPHFYVTQVEGRKNGDLQS